MNKFYEEHKNDYFEYNGARYGIGTTFTTKNKYGMVIKAVFQGQDYGGYSIMYKDTCGKTIFKIISNDKLVSSIIEILDGNYYTELEQSKQYIPDSKIPELVVGWMMYIFVMAVLTIFNDRLIGWIAVSIYFFNWRKKIKEENTYYAKKDI